MAASYIRETDRAEMVEVAPFQFVNRRSAAALGLIAAARPAPVFMHAMPKAGSSDHDFQGWRAFPDGNGGEQVCTKCGLGAMADTLARF